MKYWPAILIVSAAALSACSNNTVKSTLGLERSPPDEFRVVSRPPLSVPPQFTLRPPSATEASPNQMPTDKKAKSLLTGATPDDNDSTAADTAVVPVTTAATSHPRSSSHTTTAENKFLEKAGADKADPKVRDELVEEKMQVQESQENDSWWNPFGSTPPKKDPVVNAPKEADRIKTNEDEGKPVTEGATPEVKQKETGMLGKIFGY